MNGFFIILYLFALSFAPIILAVLFLHWRKVRLSIGFVFVYIAFGVLSLVLAAFLQGLIPEGLSTRYFSALFNVFIRTAFCEEAARLAVFFVMFWALSRFSKNWPPEESSVRGRGLIAGLSFAALETAAYAAGEPGAALIRPLSALPLHGACGVRTAFAAFSFVDSSLSRPNRIWTGTRSFISAVLVHGIYDYMLSRGAILWTALAILIALSALVSSLNSNRTRA